MASLPSSRAPTAISLGQYSDRVLSKRRKALGGSRNKRRSRNNSTPPVSRLWYPTEAHFVNCAQTFHSNVASIRRRGPLPPALRGCEAAELQRIMHEYRAIEQAVSILHAHIFPPCAFIQHGVAQAERASASPRPLQPPPLDYFEIPPSLQSVSCPLCCERLLRPGDVQWDDAKQIWGCSPRLLVPYKGQFAHPTCLPAKTHVQMQKKHTLS